MSSSACRWPSQCCSTVLTTVDLAANHRDLPCRLKDIIYGFGTNNVYVVLECLDCDLRDLLDGEKALDTWQIKVRHCSNCWLICTKHPSLFGRCWANALILVGQQLHWFRQQSQQGMVVVCVLLLSLPFRVLLLSSSCTELSPSSSVFCCSHSSTRSSRQSTMHTCTVSCTGTSNPRTYW